MSSELEKLKRKCEEEVKNSPNAESFNGIRIKYLGRKGELTKILRSLKDLPFEERKKIGQQANILKKELEDLISGKEKELSTSNFQFPTSNFDITKPGKKISRGHFHPLTKIDEEVRQIFTSMNFSVVEGPEAETEFYNFDALNIPSNHPARDVWDTLWIKNPKSEILNPKQISKLKFQNSKLLLRAHTSPMQIRYMENHNPPFQIIVPGRVFRYEATDASHEINFYQVEGLMVGPAVTLANFKFVVEEFFQRFFGRQVEFRYKPSYFPFVEPGLEVEVKLGGKWLEVMGAGMVHRKVFDAVRYNPGQVQGFAFGMGLDRLAMLKYNVPDIRLFYSGDLRFIKQF
jgi:phenylalanyl-tRNA synthetase alpha chain